MENSQSDWLAIGERRKKYSYVARYVQNKEMEYQMNLERRRNRLRELLESDSRRESEELELLREQNFYEKIKQREKIAEREANLKQEKRRQQCEWAEAILHRERCPFYRKNLSKHIENCINATREEEIELKREMRNQIESSLKNTNKNTFGT
ncbi:UNVERIFIED_CONTAM: hypothetical protein RMT77_002120 [Armadillidium vulgare]